MYSGQCLQNAKRDFEKFVETVRSFERQEVMVPKKKSKGVSSSQLHRVKLSKEQREKMLLVSLQPVSGSKESDGTYAKLWDSHTSSDGSSPDQQSKSKRLSPETNSEDKYIRSILDDDTLSKPMLAAMAEIQGGRAEGAINTSPA
jgi:hypothetical protein